MNMQRLTSLAPCLLLLITLSCASDHSISQVSPVKLALEPPFVSCTGEKLQAGPNDWSLIGTGDIVAADDENRNGQVFAGFLPIFQSTQLVIGNLEGAITSFDKPRKRYVPGVSYAFRFPPSFAQELKAEIGRAHV